MIKKISDSLKIRNLDIKNRICLPPMVPFCFNSRTDGMSSIKSFEHYQDLAKGGVGLIIQEATCISASGKLAPTQLGLWDDTHIDGLKAIINAVHKEGCKIFVQLHHAGVLGEAKETICPSPYQFANKNGTIKTGKEMSIQEIHDTQQDFIRAARRAFIAGYDGVELHGCHSYLISQFLNKRVNKRHDEYGKNPVLFITQILAGIRKEVANDFIVGIRLGAFEPTLTDAINYARELENEGIDFIDVSYGFHSESEVYVPENFGFSAVIFAAREIKKTVSIPVLAVNGIRLPDDANAVLAATDVDMVAVGRSMLVDSNWARKAISGEMPGKCLDCIKCRWAESPELCAGKKLMLR